MADQSDVENALVALAATALYPNGTDAPSITGAGCLIYRGWPTTSALNDDLTAGRINVTVFPTAEPGHNTTRYTQSWYGETAAASLTATVSGVTVTLAGTATLGQLVGLLIDGVSYVYATQSGDTPAIVAAKLTVSVAADRMATLSGATITIPGAGDVSARVVADGTTTQQVRRQEREFRITCWCADPTSRDVTASAIDVLLARYNFISLADGTLGRLLFRGSLVFDQSEDAMLYRRDLLYSVEYPTTVTSPTPSMLFGNIVLNASTITA